MLHSCAPQKRAVDKGMGGVMCQELSPYAVECLTIFQEECAEVAEVLYNLRAVPEGEWRARTDLVSGLESECGDILATIELLESAEFGFTDRLLEVARSQAMYEWRDVLNVEVAAHRLQLASIKGVQIASKVLRFGPSSTNPCDPAQRSTLARLLEIAGMIQILVRWISSANLISTQGVMEAKLAKLEKVKKWMKTHPSVAAVVSSIHSKTSYIIEGRRCNGYGGRCWQPVIYEEKGRPINLAATEDEAASNLSTLEDIISNQRDVEGAWDWERLRVVKKTIIYEVVRTGRELN